MDHDFMQALVAAYSIDALEPDEREEVRQHLHACERCRSDLEGFEQTASWLSLVTEPLPLPGGFTERVLAKRPDPIRTLGARRHTRGAFLAAAVVALLAVATWSTLTSFESRDDLRAQREVIEALVRGDDHIELSGAGEATGRVVPTEDGALFVATGLPPVGEGLVYQLWIKDGKVITSGGTFEFSQGTALVTIERRFGDFSGALVTVEPAGGSRQPTSPPVVDSV